ncbi:class II histocompatibility antigen, M alpha chain isoform X2 [Lithobates pipiens]
MSMKSPDLQRNSLGPTTWWRVDHVLSQVLFCQPNTSVPGLLKMFDNDQMFSYNFSKRTTSAWLPDFDQWSDQAFPNAANISAYLSLCDNLREALTEVLKEIMPEARGGTQTMVFTAQPLRIGMPNTLICFISDVYPPALTVIWRKNSELLSKESTSPGYFALYDGSFQAFSYLNVTPNYNDVYSCNVQVAGDSRTIVEYWVPDYPVPSDVLENALCGLGCALGIVFLFLGFMFLCLSKKLQQTDYTD